MWWGVFFTLIIALEVAFRRVVPLEHRRRYARSPKGREYYLAIILWHLIWTTSAIQNLVAPAPAPTWQRIGGIVFFILGHALLFWARRVNPFFVPALVEPERIVKTGPYAFMEDPGYVGMAIAAHGPLLIFGQWWAVFPAAAYQILLLRRAIIEDRFLSQL